LDLQGCSWPIPQGLQLGPTNDGPTKENALEAEKDADRPCGPTTPTGSAAYWTRTGQSSLELAASTTMAERGKASALLVGQSSSLTMIQRTHRKLVADLAGVQAGTLQGFLVRSSNVANPGQTHFYFVDESGLASTCGVTH
jgi:hypothetical protein